MKQGGNARRSSEIRLRATVMAVIGVDHLHGERTAGERWATLASRKATDVEQIANGLRAQLLSANTQKLIWSMRTLKRLLRDGQ